MVDNSSPHGYADESILYAELDDWGGRCVKRYVMEKLSSALVEIPKGTDAKFAHLGGIRRLRGTADRLEFSVKFSGLRCGL
jgi:hypothetical protein